MMIPTCGAEVGARRVADLRRFSTRPVITSTPAGVVSLAMGEPDFSTPAPITEAAARALRDGHTHYADQQGLAVLRSAIADRLPSTGRARWSPSQVLVTHGATGGLAALISGLIGEGDRVVIPEPTYSLYADLVTLSGGVVDFVPLDPSLHWDIDRLRRVVPGAKAVVICNPSNPTGIVHDRAQLEALAVVLEGTETILIADEAYRDLTFPGTQFVSALDIDALADRTVYVQTFSKSYAMTGWRIGYLAGPQALIDVAATVQRTTVGSLNTSVQFGALRALELGDTVIQPMLDAYTARREIVTAELRDTRGLTLTASQATFYAFVRYSNTDLPAPTVVSKLAEAGVLTRSGAEFGPSGDDHIRISFATSEKQLREGLSRIKAYFATSFD